MDEAQQLAVVYRQTSRLECALARINRTFIQRTVRESGTSDEIHCEENSLTFTKNEIEKSPKEAIDVSHKQTCLRFPIQLLLY